MTSRQPPGDLNWAQPGARVEWDVVSLYPLQKRLVTGMITSVSAHGAHIAIDNPQGETHGFLWRPGLEAYEIRQRKEP